MELLIPPPRPKLGPPPGRYRLRFSQLPDRGKVDKDVRLAASLEAFEAAVLEPSIDRPAADSGLGGCRIDLYQGLSHPA